MELEFFIKPDEAAAKAPAHVRNNGIPATQPNWGWERGTNIGSRSGSAGTRASVCRRNTLDLHWQKKEELAHYAKATVDILFKFPFGTAGT